MTGKEFHNMRKKHAYSGREVARHFEKSGYKRTFMFVYQLENAIDNTGRSQRVADRWSRLLCKLCEEPFTETCFVVIVTRGAEPIEQTFICRAPNDLKRIHRQYRREIAGGVKTRVVSREIPFNNPFSFYELQDEPA